MAVQVAHRTATVDRPVYRAEQVDAIMRTDVTSMCCAPAEAVEPDVVLELGEPAPVVEAAPDVLPAVEPGVELVAPLEPDELASMPVTSIS